jgi:hypothetical protein
MQELDLQSSAVHLHRVKATAAGRDPSAAIARNECHRTEPQVHLGEGESNGEVRQPVDRARHAHGLRPHSARVDLRADEPRNRSEADLEERHEHQHHTDARDAHPGRRARTTGAGQVGLQSEGESDAAEHHAVGGQQQQWTTTRALDEVYRQTGREDIHEDTTEPEERKRGAETQRAQESVVE